MGWAGAKRTAALHDLLVNEPITMTARVVSRSRFTIKLDTRIVIERGAIDLKTMVCIADKVDLKL